MNETVLARATTDEETRVELRDFLYDYQATLDEQRLTDWVDLFVEDGSYAVINVENERDRGLYLYRDDGLEARKERVAFVMGYWRMARMQTMRTVSNVRLVGAEGEEAQVRSKFVVYRTARDGVTRLHVCGEYQDRFVRTGAGWRLREHRVAIENGLLPDDFTDIL